MPQNVGGVHVNVRVMRGIGLSKCEYCDKPGKLRKECHNIHFMNPRTLCQEHYKQSKAHFDTPCRICGTERRTCCC